MIDVVGLRALLRPFIGDLKDTCTDSKLPELCQRLGLPIPEQASSKRDRLHAAVDALSDEAFPAFAQRLVDSRTVLPPPLRNQVQDLLWADAPGVEIPKRQRREVARALDRMHLFRNWEAFEQLLRDVFILDASPTRMLLGRAGVLEEIHRHFVRFPEDADVEALFDQLKAFDLSDRRFGNLLTGLTSADVQVDAEAQLAIVGTVNPVIQVAGAELRQTGESGGYPVFGLVALHAVRGRPKNLIFASHSKPDIRFRDAVNNDIEIASRQDEVLVYDRPLGADGLRWSDLQGWWADSTQESDPVRAKDALYRRLAACLPESSPPQRRFFKAYFQSFGSAIPSLPALLPEVWLHWDPKTVAQRGAKALLNHRMDFLMLLPAGVRVVIEIDGMQHYADVDSGRADTRLYAQLAAGDRELKLAGYEVYRFGGVELQGDDAPVLVKAFFESLFKRHGVAWT